MLRALTILAVAIYAANGALKALDHRMDLFGTIVIALVTAIGGGTVRDLLLSRPVFWVIDPIFLQVGSAVALLVVLATRRIRVARRTPGVLDAIGLALFASIGAHTAYQTGAPAVTTVLTGAMTGFAGGIVRDVLCGEVPRVLRQDIHATAAISGAALYTALRLLAMPAPPSIALAILLVFLIRLLVLRHRDATVARRLAHPPTDVA